MNNESTVLLTGVERDNYIKQHFPSSLPFTGDDLLTFVNEAKASYDRQGLALN